MVLLATGKDNILVDALQTISAQGFFHKGHKSIILAFFLAGLKITAINWRDDYAIQFQLIY